jgi:uncharacterized protein (DUF934 family)
MKYPNAAPESYRQSQLALAELKGAIYSLLSAADERGLTNAQIGRSLGIYAGHVRHVGHISRTLLTMMEEEGVVEQNAETKFWRIREHSDAAD